jgi:hypothetical protein
MVIRDRDTVSHTFRACANISPSSSAPGPNASHAGDNGPQEQTQEILNTFNSKAVILRLSEAQRK